MLQQNYDTQASEKKWHELWEKNGIYKWNPNIAREDSYVIDTPPPTVSGLLHMGHIFSYTQADIIARYQRMSGKNVFYPIGFDDNGLPTERLVEKVKEVRAVQMPRADFIKLCQEVVAESEEEFRRLFRAVGLSFDWGQEYQTISDQSRKLSQMSFLDLIKKGRIERKDSPTFWDPVDRTAIAQAEIEDKERQSTMNYVIFKTEDGQDLTIATTRPELFAACLAVMYHPEDERYKHLAGKKVVTPIFGHKVPMIADEDVLMDKGSGLAYCSCFGDFLDLTWIMRHKLPFKNFITKEGKMQYSGVYDGMYAKDARVKILDDLKEQGLLIKQEPITQMVKVAERSKAPLEIISTPQWYIKILDKKEELLQKANECNWFPDYMKVRLEHWINGLNQDWCISRQRYFGVPFPVWYSKRVGEEGKVLFAEIDQLPVDPLVDLPKGYTKEEVTPDVDVMDTWATSSISPQLNSRGISEDFVVDAQRHNQLFPADLRPQAHEIIRTWTFYTIVKALYHSDTIPWKNIILSGWCLAADKTKMSKSKGNTVTPTELIIEKGADVIRYWASTSRLGVDIAYSEDVFKIGKKLVNKLWNASKFAALQFANLTQKPTTAKQDVESGFVFETMDLWILSRLQKATEKATKAFKEYEYCDARVAIEDFFWNDLCDNYLEIIKGRSYDENPENAKSRQSAIITIHHVLKTLFRLFAPFVPHICDELNEGIFGGESVNSRGAWPKIEEHFYAETADVEGKNAVEVLALVRKFKSEKGISIKTPLEHVYYAGCELNDSVANDIKNASNAVSIKSVANLDGEITTLENTKIQITAKLAIVD
jgi:valyl-tRNA synthetase